jgi:hypothetical protein
LGSGGQLQCHQARLDGRHRRLSQRRRHLHRLHHARFSGQGHAVHGRAARRHGLALPGYEKVGQRRILLGCWGSWNNPDVCDFTYQRMNEWGKAMYVTPGVIVDGKAVTNNLVDINLGIRILLGSSFYDDWEHDEMFVKTDPLGIPVDRRHPWNQRTTP